MEFIKPGTRIDFVGKMKVAVSISAAVIMATVGLWYTIGPNYGIDFRGGSEVEITFLKSVAIDEVRNVVEGLNLGSVEVKSMGGISTGGATYLIRIEKKELETEGESGESVDVTNIVIKALEDQIGPYDKDMLGTSMVGPRAAPELRQKAVTAIFIALVCMLVYIAVRFEILFSVGAVLALFHDVCITMGILIIAHKEFNLTTIAALLTIVGYSLNDTIVVYDRIRENTKKFIGQPFGDLVNTSINETLSRTVLTSGTTLFVVLVLLFVTAGALQDFAFAMTVGVLVGTYSSVFIASAFVVFWETRVAPSLEKSKKQKAAKK